MQDINKIALEMWNDLEKWVLFRENNEFRSKVSLKTFKSSPNICYKLRNKYDAMLQGSDIIKSYFLMILDLLTRRPEYFYAELITIPIGSNYLKKDEFKFNRNKKIMYFKETVKERKTEVRWTIKKETFLNNHKPNLKERIKQYLLQVTGKPRTQREKITKESYVPIYEEVEISKTTKLLYPSCNPYFNWDSIFNNTFNIYKGLENITNKIGIDSPQRDYFIKSIEFMKEDTLILEKICTRYLNLLNLSYWQNRF